MPRTSNMITVMKCPTVPCGYLVINDDAYDSKSVPVTDDHSFPALARTCGMPWPPPRRVRFVDDPPGCPHDGTDGSIDCPSCGVSAATFISVARRWLDANLPKSVEDPGYFTGQKS